MTFRRPIRSREASRHTVAITGCSDLCLTLRKSEETLERGFLVLMEVVTVFSSLKVVNSPVRPLFAKRYPSTLFKVGRKPDKLEKPGRKIDKKPKITYSAGKQKPEKT